MKKAGYTKMDIYNAIPDYNEPICIAPTKNSQIYNYLMHHLIDLQAAYANKLVSSIAMLFSKAGLVKYFLPSFIIFAKK